MKPLNMRGDRSLSSPCCGVDPTHFAKPPSQHRGAPFFALNHDLSDHQRLREHLAAFEVMGLGGAHLHVRSGLRTPYLGPVFLDAIRVCREFAASRGLLTYLYDEDTWPSGFGGGTVTRDHRFRARWAELRQGGPDPDSNALKPEFLAAYRLTFDDGSTLREVERVELSEADDACWYLTRWIAPDSDRFNGAAYLDVLNPAAVDAFIECTHEVYREAFGGSFPSDVPAIFTDEPQLSGGHHLAGALAGIYRVPWTDDLPDSFASAHGEELLDALPWLVWQGQTGTHPIRWMFWDHLTARFTEAYSHRIGGWCARNGIALTGHLQSEDSLAGQSDWVGECMRHYPAYEIPGIDVLCDNYLPATAKQAVSVARQMGRKAVLSELYGVTNWDFPFAGHKRQGDWQAALGITLRVHHLTWLSMEGQGKRDFPASIGIQSPWYREYPLIEDHFARVNVALATGKPLVRIGVVHPVESAWLHRGLAVSDAAPTQRLETGFEKLVTTLLEATLDFDFISESLLPGLERMTGQPVLPVGEMAYEVVVVPRLETIRATTLTSLGRFLERGGRVFVLGGCPGRCEGALSQKPEEALAEAVTLPDASSLVDALEPWRELSVTDLRGISKSSINHQFREDGANRVLFLSNRQASTTWNPYHGLPDPGTRIQIRGEWQVRELDTVCGREKDCAHHQKNGWTVVPWYCQPTSHRLLCLVPGTGEHPESSPSWQVLGDCPEPGDIIRGEPNVLLLDQPEWRIEDEDAWQPSDDSLMVQLELAKRFGWPDWSQPYTVTDPGRTVTVHRRFRFRTETDLTGLQLVCERASAAEIRLDGQLIDATPSGHWVDRDLPTVDLPPLDRGEHSLEIALALDAVDRHLEWCYLLGSFDVETRGRHAWLVAADNALYWGDVVHQGLPFYGGNLEYELDLTVGEGAEYALRIPNFSGPLLRVWCDERDCGPVAFEPFRCPLGRLGPGPHHVRIRAYGNRCNTFGALHNNRPEYDWFGTRAWRLPDAGRNLVWQFKPAGILRAPLLERML